tara:strand:+ start:3630 stop:4343 length:714 start_codon:yes stop_codon:yes gene_type:complete
MLKSYDTSNDSDLIKSLMELFYANAPRHYLNVFVRELSKTQEFKLMRQCDAHELFLYLTDSLFTQLKSYKNPFMGNLESTITCFVCKAKSVTTYPFASLSVQIPLVECTVDQLLTDFCKEETLTDKIMCDSCKVKQPCSKTLSVQPAPLLAIHLKRFNGMKKLYTEILIQDEIKIQSSKYRLYSLCNHSGNSFGGHYTATCMKRDGSWIMLNDNHVGNLSCLPQKSDRPYILFYYKV